MTTAAAAGATMPPKVKKVMIPPMVKKVAGGGALAGGAPVTVTKGGKIQIPGKIGLSHDFRVPTLTQPSIRNFAGLPAGAATQINIGGKQQQVVNLNAFQIQTIRQPDGTEIQVSYLEIND